MKYETLHNEYNAFLKSIGWLSAHREVGKKNDASEFLYFLMEVILNDLNTVREIPYPIYIQYV